MNAERRFPKGMLCPTCRVPLMMSERQGLETDRCPQCRGVWLDRDELDPRAHPMPSDRVERSGGGNVTTTLMMTAITTSIAIGNMVTAATDANPGSARSSIDRRCRACSARCARSSVSRSDWQ